MNEGDEIWAGGANAWECDEMGHLNVRFWMAKALEALAGLAAQLGMPQAFKAGAGSTLLVCEQHIRFLSEARAGTWLWATGGVVEIEPTQARLFVVIRHLSGQPAATFLFRVSHVTSEDLRPFPWPKRVTAAAVERMVEVPAFAMARGIDLKPQGTTAASLERAVALGLDRIGLGTVQAVELDVFGRMRGEMFAARVSDGVAKLFGNDRPGPVSTPGEPPSRIGGAVMEYRILHHDWPRAGDHVEVRSGLSETTPRIRRVIHWMVDPISGKPWVTAEAIALSFDLDTRKVIDINPQAHAALSAQVIPGLGL